MTRYVALLRAVNVGGTSKLPMADLAAMCADAGFVGVRTYIASGNVVFDAQVTAASVKKALEKRLAAYAGKPVGVMVRTAKAMADVLADNPFPTENPRATVVVFLDDPPPGDALEKAVGRVDERMRLGKREINIAYPSGIGLSKLRIAAAKSGTMRNMNTVARLVEIASENRTRAAG